MADAPLAAAHVESAMGAAESPLFGLADAPLHAAGGDLSAVPLAHSPTYGAIRASLRGAVGDVAPPPVRGADPPSPGLERTPLATANFYRNFCSMTPAHPPLDRPLVASLPTAIVAPRPVKRADPPVHRSLGASLVAAESGLPVPLAKSFAVDGVIRASLVTTAATTPSMLLRRIISVVSIFASAPLRRIVSTSIFVRLISLPLLRSNHVQDSLWIERH
eukprot:CAMPEP_0172533270 /NCGR_PEP_ID=MMETSP1067-20121228/6039_1 /TAXON_ID=265564 ORGANISM="Thalassiosira punctigera, Strain Tpunct2005C2" /NCGR_SAMPLE_ID=MMETSP1067 /ASSEMBLY_ACC=CAM_ASM_000444 /LENGTH=218 /DNA_ID=CAMNT_0013317895 /DNA_START=152 /DNA_END=808 /DNA_ORIENTATION=+